MARKPKTQAPSPEIDEVEDLTIETATVEEVPQEEISPKAPVAVAVIALADLYEPTYKKRIPRGVRMEFPAITNWMQCQIDAKLLERVG